MTRKLGDLTCATCSKPMWMGKGTLPQGQARCRECRRHVESRVKRNACAECGAPCFKVYCSSRCATIANNAKRGRYGQTMTGSRKLRATRAATAPGLSDTARRRLLARWKRQRRSCSYCPAPADTIDHVVPLLRGGDNREGNLTPCCRRCNASKCYLLLIEWRSGKRLPPPVTIVQARRPKRTRSAPPPVQLELRTCPRCGSLHTRPKFCSPECCQGAWQIGRRQPLSKWLREYVTTHGPSLSHDVRAAAARAGYNAASVSQARKSSGLHSAVLHGSDGGTLGAIWSLQGVVPSESTAA